MTLTPPNSDPVVAVVLGARALPKMLPVAGVVEAAPPNNEPVAAEAVVVDPKSDDEVVVAVEEPNNDEETVLADDAPKIDVEAAGAKIDPPLFADVVVTEKRDGPGVFPKRAALEAAPLNIPPVLVEVVEPNKPPVVDVVGAAPVEAPNNEGVEVTAVDDAPPKRGAAG